MGKINKANIIKTLHYLRRNGVAAAFYAAMERLDSRREIPYMYHAPSTQELERQRCIRWEHAPLLSILVPCYRTDKRYIKELMESVLAQTYPNWELILADATEDDSVVKRVSSYQDARILYVHLDNNGGISDNTNAGVKAAHGEYIGLLDHDDLLTPDALYAMACRIRDKKAAGQKPRLLYSDEDKCSHDALTFYEPHRKTNFNLDLLLSNNYICHFLMMERELMLKTGFRRAYDGAQDYDLVLRAVAQILPWERDIVHIPKVLYHWRSHPGSTSENPGSKQYAYEAGRLALQDFADGQGWKAKACHLKHVGYYKLEYQGGILANRRDVGAVGGKLIRRGRITGSIYQKDGTALYEGLPAKYSGYMHRAVLRQDAGAVDIRLLQVKKEARQILEQQLGYPYRTEKDGDCFDVSRLPEDTDYAALSLKLCRALREAGYRIVWDPDLYRRI